MSPPQNPSHEDRIERLVAACLERSPDDPSRVVSAVCEGDDELSRDVRDSLTALAELGLGFEQRAAAMPLRLGPFRLVRPLGAGAMGLVHLAEKEPEGQRVALKILRPELVHFPRAQKRFRREMRIVADLEHPNLVRMHSHGTTDGLPWIALEHAQGATVAQVLTSLGDVPIEGRRGSDLARVASELSESGVSAQSLSHPHQLTSWTRAVLHLVSEVARALAHAHGRGIVHRDVKPSNIMVSPSGRALLFDFGLAADVGRAATITRSGVALGSEAYMAPEVLGGEARPDERSDVYSLGAVLYELLTGTRPFLDGGRTGFRERVLAGGPPCLRNDGIGISEDVDRVCRAALARYPADRPASAQEFADDLERVLEHRPVRSRPPGRAQMFTRWLVGRPEVGVAGAIVLGALVGLGVLWRDNVRMEQRLAQVQWETETKYRNILQTFEASDDYEGMPAHVRTSAFLDEMMREPLPVHVKAELALGFGRDQRQLGAVEPARETIRSAMSMFQSLTPQDPQWIARAAVELARCELAVGDKQAARESVKAQLNAAKDRPEPLPPALRAELLILRAVTNWEAASPKVGEWLGEAQELLAGTPEVDLQVEALAQLVTHHSASGAAADHAVAAARLRDALQAPGLDRERAYSARMALALGAKRFGDWQKARDDLAALVLDMGGIERGGVGPAHASLVRPIVVHARLLVACGQLGESRLGFERAARIMEASGFDSDWRGTVAGLAAEAALLDGAPEVAWELQRQAEVLAADSHLPVRVPLVRLARAGLAQRSGDLEQADAIYAALVPELDVFDTAVSDSAVLAALLNRAQLLQQQGRDAELGRVLDAARERVTSMHAALEARRKKRSKLKAEPLRATDPGALILHEAQGRVALMAGRLDEAQESFLRLLLLREELHPPGHWRLHQARALVGEVLMARGDLDAAQLHFEQAWAAAAADVGERSDAARRVAQLRADVAAQRHDAADEAVWRERAGDVPLLVAGVGL